MNVFMPLVNLFDWFVDQAPAVRIILVVGWTAGMIALGWTIEHLAERRRRKAEAYPRYLRRY